MSPLVVDVVLLVVGIGALYFGAEWMVRGAARLAAAFGVSSIVVGLTVVSLGTSAPELVVCVVAALEGRPDIATGNVLGSNLANMGLILGLTSLITPLNVHSRVVWREMPIMLAITLLLYPLFWDLSVSRVDGIVLIGVLGAYLFFAFRSVGDKAPEILGEYEEFVAEEPEPAPPRLKDVLFVLAGSLGLVAGGYLIVEGAVGVGTALGISEVVIGLTVVAVGTSLPELATAIVAAIRKEADIAVGNVIGSNIFNLAGILGVTATVSPIPIARTVLTHELAVVTVMSVVLFPLLWLGWRLRRWEGAFLLVGYVGAFFFLI
ncbi:MAG: calcium/sodium antiporter [Gemmatimonadota bacterium]|nr:calcium/sodium antiporter [Gemmatimonadota bacterium]